MSYLSSLLPFPTPSFDAAEFWHYCSKRQLMFQTCGECAVSRHPPVPVCPNCNSKSTTWTEAPHVGKIFSYTVVYNASHEAIKDNLPYNIVLVEFEGLEDLRLVSNVVDAKPADLAIGRHVEVIWEEGPGGQLLPRFKLNRE